MFEIGLLKLFYLDIFKELKTPSSINMLQQICVFVLVSTLHPLMWCHVCKGGLISNNLSSQQVPCKLWQAFLAPKVASGLQLSAN